MWVSGGANAQVECSETSLIRGNAHEGLVAEGNGTLIHALLQTSDLNTVCRGNGDCPEDDVCCMDGGKIHISTVESADSSASNARETG